MVKLWIFGSILQKHLSPLLIPPMPMHVRSGPISTHGSLKTKKTNDMQLETELRNVSMEDLTVHDYFEKFKKLRDLLEGLGELIRDCNLFTHTINGLSRKYEGVACIIRFTRPFPSFSKMRSMLALEENLINSPTPITPTHDSHSSSPSLLHVGTTSSNRGGGGGSYRGSNNNFR